MRSRERITEALIGLRGCTGEVQLILLTQLHHSLPMDQHLSCDLHVYPVELYTG